jgi:GNAT superfamily N-acetyltransferase
MGMRKKKLFIRTMSRAEIDLAVDWAAREGWNPGLYDADSFYAADPNGFLIGHLGDEPVAIISVVKYGSSFGFLGFYIVRPEYRGQGYGLQIWNAGLKYLIGRNIGLDGVVDQHENYKKSGFKLAYRNVRYEGVGDGRTFSSAKIARLSTLPFEIIEAYDIQFFPEKRTDFLKSWINQPDCMALGVLKDGNLVAMGVIRKCRSGYKIGPLFADTPDLAEELLMAFKSEVKPGEPFYLDVPEVNQAAVALAGKFNMKVVFETARMYTGEKPDLRTDRLYGVTTFELG